MGDYSPPINEMSQQDLDNEECIICFSPLYQGDPVEIINCRHRFHRHCLQGHCENAKIENTLQKCKCPICNKIFDFTAGLTPLMPEVERRRRQLQEAEKRRIEANFAERQRRVDEERQNKKYIEMQQQSEIRTYGRVLPRTSEGIPIIPPGANEKFRYILHVGTRNLQKLSSLDINKLLENPKNFHCIVLLLNKYSYSPIPNIPSATPSPEIIAQTLMREIYNNFQYFEIEEIDEIIENLKRAVDNISSESLHEERRKHNFQYWGGPHELWSDEFERRRNAVMLVITHSPLREFRVLIDNNHSIVPPWGWGVNRGANWDSIMPALEETSRCIISIIENYLRQRQQTDRKAMPRGGAEDMSIGGGGGPVIPPQNLSPVILSQLDIGEFLQNPTNSDCLIEFLAKYRPMRGVNNLDSFVLHTREQMRNFFINFQTRSPREIREIIRELQTALNEITPPAISLSPNAWDQLGGQQRECERRFQAMQFVLSKYGFGDFIQSSHVFYPGGHGERHYPHIFTILERLTRCVISIIENYLRQRTEASRKAMPRGGAEDMSIGGGGQAYSRGGRKKSRNTKKSKRRQRKSRKLKKKSKK